MLLQGAGSRPGTFLPSRLSTQLALAAGFVLLVLFALQVFFASFALGILQDKTEQQILSPYAAEAAEIVATSISRNEPFHLLEQKLYERFHAASEIGIFLISPEGELKNDLSFVNPIDLGEAKKTLPSPPQVLERIKDFQQRNSKSLWPSYFPDLTHPGAKVPFAAANLSVGENHLGYLLVTPGTGLRRILGSISLDVTGLILALVGLGLSLSGALFLGWLAFRRTASRFSLVTQSVERISKGDFSTLPAVEGPKDEISQIASAIRTLVISLESRRRENQMILSSVTHDLHSPLAVIAGYAESLSTGEGEHSPPQLKKQAEVIAKSARSASDMLSELMELAGLEAETENSRPRRINLNDLLDEVAMSLERRAAVAGVTLRTHFENEGNFAYVQGGKIERVLSNLSENALRHTPEGGEVVLAIHGVGSLITVSVEDNGEGIPPEELENILRPFSQGTHLSKGKKGIAGLGLAICREILLRNGSELRVESKVGQGTKFSFSFLKKE